MGKFVALKISQKLTKAIKSEAREICVRGERKLRENCEKSKILSIYHFSMLRECVSKF